MELHQIRLPLPLRLNHVNSYLIVGPGGHALVDAGMATPACRQALTEQLEAHGLQPAQLGQLFVTHFHGDHWGLAAWLGDLGVEVLMPRLDGTLLHKWLVHPEYDQRALGEYVSRGVPEKILRRAGRALEEMRRVAPVFEADRTVEDGDLVQLAGEPFKVLITPGHSPGHACLLHEASRTLLCGDHVLPHITPNISRELAAAENPLGQYRGSLRRVRGLGVACAWPAHGEPMYDLDRRIDEILAHHEQREALVLEALEEGPRTAFEVACRLFDFGRLDAWESWMALGETMAHVVALRESGKLLAETDADGLERYRRAPACASRPAP
jgi:glyoxylase-like metal-dependent hydrolase (beta-lactamase superfamily II)